MNNKIVMLKIIVIVIRTFTHLNLYNIFPHRGFRNVLEVVQAIQYTPLPC